MKYGWKLQKKLVSGPCIKITLTNYYFQVKINFLTLNLNFVIHHAHTNWKYNVNLIKLFDLISFLLILAASYLHTYPCNTCCVSLLWPVKCSLSLYDFTCLLLVDFNLWKQVLLICFSLPLPWWKPCEIETSLIFNIPFSLLYLTVPGECFLSRTTCRTDQFFNEYAINLSVVRSTNL